MSDTPRTDAALLDLSGQTEASRYTTADFARQLERELGEARKAAGFCDQHQPNGGARNCTICGLIKLSAALSEICMILEKVDRNEPNSCCSYDVHCNETVVVEQVRTRIAELEKLITDANRGAERNAKALMLSAERVAELEKDKARLDWLEQIYTRKVIDNAMKSK